MSMQDLKQSLEADKALHFDSLGGPREGEGWAWKYADVAVRISFSGDFLLLYRRNGTEVDPEDLKDLKIIGRKAGYSVNEPSYKGASNCIAFLGGSTFEEDVDF